MTMRLDTLDPPVTRLPARHAPVNMTRLGVSTDELEGLIQSFLIRAATERAANGYSDAEFTLTHTAQFLRDELELHQRRYAHGWRRVLHLLAGVLVALIAPLLGVCLLLGMFDLGQALI